MFYLQLCTRSVDEGCTNPGHQVVVETKLCKAMHNICVSPVGNLLQIVLLAPRFLWQHLDFWKICTSLI